MLLVLYTTGIIPNELRESLKLLNLRPALCNVMQQALILNVCHVVGKFLAEQ